MSKDLYVDRVRERDLDNFLVEELQASTPFRTWFIANLSPTFEAPADEVRVRKSPPRTDGRQTDVELGWFDEHNELTACVLIESKITADFQPGQAEAYRAETQRHRVVLGASRTCSVLVAPAARLATLPEREAFDSALPLEDVADVLRRRLIEEVLPDEIAARLSVRAGLLDALCGKRSGGAWSPVTIEGKRDFAQRYAEMAKLVVPALSVRPSADGPKALTRIFEGLAVPSDFPCSVALRHEFGTGVGYKYANLLLSGAVDRATALQARRDLFEPIGAEIVAAGKSLAIRRPTPALVPTGDRFDEQKDKVREGLAAVRTLADWFEVHHGTLAILLGAEGVRLEPQDSKVEQMLLRGEPLPDFESEMRSLAREAEAVYGYRPGYFLDLLDRYGGEGTAHRLLAGEPSKGFLRLWELGALHLSVEALVGREPWVSSNMFDATELLRARRRLKDAGYTVDKRKDRP